jgi:hypothetical protein
VSLLDKLLPLERLAKQTGRSFWRATFRDGRVVAETAVPDWMHLDKRGLHRLELVCPDGQVKGIAAGAFDGRDIGECFFQFKIGSVDSLIDLNGGGGGTLRQTIAHVIGCVDSGNGDCTCLAWEYPRQWTSEDPTRMGSPTVIHTLPGRLYGPFRDVYPHLKYAPGLLSSPRLDILGVR